MGLVPATSPCNKSQGLTSPVVCADLKVAYYSFDGV